MTGGMSRELEDFLTRLLDPRTRSMAQPDAAQVCSQHFYEYLHAVGVEHCNYGGFQLSGAKAQATQFSGSLLPEPFIEEFFNELAQDDYIQLRAQDLTETSPVASFDFGLFDLDRIEDYHAPARRVHAKCARHGMEDGIALIAQSPATNGEGERFFGFAFGGTGGSGQIARDRFAELQVAAFAMLDRITPQINAVIEGFAYDLTERERDVLVKVSQGNHRKQIAFDLNLSLPTIDMHLANLRRKLGAQTLAEAVAKGYRFGILD